jgi:Flp pilus assembly protein TadG
MHVQRPAAHRGAAAVEFAFVLPLFVLFLFGLLEMGRALMSASLLASAARAGCRAGIVPSAKNADVTAAVQAKMAGAGLGGKGNIVITVNGTGSDVSSAETRDRIGVTVSLDYEELSWLPFARWIDGKITGRFTLPHE